MRKLREKSGELHMFAVTHTDCSSHDWTWMEYSIGDMDGYLLSCMHIKVFRLEYHKTCFHFLILLWYGVVETTKMLYCRIPGWILSNPYNPFFEKNQIFLLRFWVFETQKYSTSSSSSFWIITTTPFWKKAWFCSGFQVWGPRDSRRALL